MIRLKNNIYTTSYQLIFSNKNIAMLDTTVDGDINYSTKYRGIPLSEHIQNFYKIECEVNNWLFDPIDPSHYGYNMYAKMLDSFFKNGCRINTKKIHTAWAYNYLYWVTERPWEKTDTIKQYKGETEEKTLLAYDGDIPEHKKKSILTSFKIFRKRNNF